MIQKEGLYFPPHGKRLPASAPASLLAGKRQVVLLALLLSLLGLNSAHGQAPNDDAPSPPVIDVETIEALRKQAAESTDLDSDTKQKIDAACAQGLDGLKRIRELEGQAERFKRDAEDVGQRVETLRQQLVNLQRQPALPSFATLPALEQEVSRREVALAELKAAQAKLEAELTTRANRRREIRELVLSVKQRSDAIQEQLDTAAPTDEPPLLTQARRADLLVRKLLIEAESPTLQNELAKYDAEDAADYLRIERDVRTEEVKQASTELQALQEQLSQRLVADSAAALQRARDAVATTDDALKSEAEHNVSLAELAHALSQPIEDTRREVDQTTNRLEGIQKQFAATQQRVADIGLTGSIGAHLRRQRVALPDLRQRRKHVLDRKTLIERAQYQVFQYDEIRSLSTDKMVQDVLASVTEGESRDDERLETAARTLVDRRREHLDRVIRNYNSYLDAMFELDATEQRLIRETVRYQEYIDERVLWIRSNLFLFSSYEDFDEQILGATNDRVTFSSFQLDASDTWAFDATRWADVGNRLQEDVREHRVVYAVTLGVFLLLVWLKPRLRGELASISQTIGRKTNTEFLPTLRAGFLTLVLLITWPGLVLFIAWRLNSSANGSEFARALAQALLSVSWVYLPLEFLRRVCRPDGLGEAHFDWPMSTISVLKPNVRWAMIIGLPLVFVTSLLYASDPEHGIDSVERICFAAGMVVLAIFLKRVLRPDTGIFREYLAAHSGGWLDRLRTVWYWGCVLTPLTIAGMTIVGYYYTAQQLAWRFYGSFVFLLCLHLLRGFLQRLLLVRRRAVSIQQAKERRAAEAASRELSGDAAALSPNQIVPPEELQPDVAANTEQSQRLIQTGLIAVSLVGMWLIWVDVLPALRILDRLPVWTTTVTVSAQSASLNGSSSNLSQTDPPQDAAPPVTQPTSELRHVTVADIGLALLIGIVTFVCARNVPGLMELSVLQRLPLDHSIRYAVTSITSYAIVLLGVILAFHAVSIGWSKVQWLATALTFGLAFGLQEIFANFVAGLMLLFERPLRIGDVVTVDNVTGVVSRIRIRATTITNWDRKEYVIPNKEFITGRMLNWTLSDKTNRIIINVGVAYGSDVLRAKELLLQTCHEHPLILEEPPTIVTFEGFGDNSLNLVVRTFLPDLDNRLPVIDDLHTAIEKVFRQAEIEIAFPQRDLHVRSVDASVLKNIRDSSPRKAG